MHIDYAWNTTLIPQQTACVDTNICKYVLMLYVYVWNF